MYASMIGQMIDQVDRLQHLADVSVPTLVVVGEQDRPFVRPSQAMAAAVPGARLAAIPDAGHSPQFENPDARRAVMPHFLGSPSPPTRPLLVRLLPEALNVDHPPVATPRGRPPPAPP